MSEISSPSLYIINQNAAKALRGKNAYQQVKIYLQQHPELKKRLRDPEYVVEGKSWGYFDQCYGSDATMRHLIALQIKAMAERQELDSIAEAFDEDDGIGSKSHKDKGTINNVFSFWGHPVRDEILVSSKASTLHVYNVFRNTIKNELKRFLRQQSLDWHLQDTTTKTQQTIIFLDQRHPQKVKSLQRQLAEINLDLETLIRRGFETNLLS